MTGGMARCLADADLCGDSPAAFSGRACGYLARLGYRLEDGAALWLALMCDKGRRKRWPHRLTAGRIMAHVYRVAGWPPALMP